MKPALKPRNPGSRKGDNGRLLVIGGSSRYYGAPALVSLAAMRTGVDLVYTVVPEKIAPTVASYSPDLIVWGYEGDELNEKAMHLLEELASKTDALVIRNGLTKSPGAIKTAQLILDFLRKPVVIDADPIGLVKVKRKNVIFTPHEGEFLRLTGKKAPSKIEERARLVKSEAKRLGAIILLKGPVDVISDGEQVYLNKTGNSAMTCGGTGDALAGIVGGLLSQKYSQFEAACLGARINGLAGDIAFKKLGYSMRASDLIGFIGDAMWKMGRRRA
jgi:hydroxyethylthiazole kinase-like uncharacterized protein yjeF